MPDGNHQTVPSILWLLSTKNRSTGQVLRVEWRSTDLFLFLYNVTIIRTVVDVVSTIVFAQKCRIAAYWLYFLVRIFNNDQEI